MEPKNQTSPVSANLAANSGTPLKSYLIALALIGIVLGVSIVPIVVALLLNRQFRRRHPGYKPFRWGYYFSLMAFIGGLLLGIFLESTTALIVCGIIYAVLAWFFAQRHRWAWITLTILSFNPVAWIVNFIYLRKRWAEAL